MANDNCNDRLVARTASSRSGLEFVQNESEADSEWTELAPGTTLDDYTPGPPLPATVPPPTQRLSVLATENETRLLRALENKRQDVQVNDGEPGVCGLLNMGNTCYLNAALQCILVLPQLITFYLGEDIPKPSFLDSTANSFGKDTQSTLDTKMSNNVLRVDGVPDQEKQRISFGHISVRLSTVFRKYWSGQFSALLPKHLKTTVGLFNTQFASSQQQDSQEFLEVLLGMLHDDLCRWQGRSETLVSSCFQGRLRSQVTCIVCRHSSVKTDPFLHLSLPIPHSHQQQLVLHWSPLNHQSGRRIVTRLLLVLPKVCSARKIKEELCSVLNGTLDPDFIILALVKENCVNLTLDDSAVVKKDSIDKQCTMYAFENRPDWFQQVLFNSEEQGQPNSVRGSAGELVQEDCLADKELLRENPPCTSQSCSSADKSPTIPAKSSKMVVSKWHSCAICLEEMMDTELLIHFKCGTVICHSCLEASQQHHSSAVGSSCPVCLASTISPTFLPLVSSNDESPESAALPVVRLIQMTVIFRHKSSPGVWVLLGHPAIVNVPASGHISEYLTLVSCLLPPVLSTQPWFLALTDTKGQFCSRCLFGSGCAGCQLLTPSEFFSPRPGDFLTISFSSLSQPYLEAAGQAQLHSSLEMLWSEQTSLLDCLELFSQEEQLGECEPWYCEQCNKKQPVRRQLLASKLPPVLVIQLKRFLFHEGSASRVDMAVEFPYLLPGSAFPGATEPVGDMHLVGCVCHTGTLSYGHYTAYSRHPLHKKWHFFNDESVFEGRPSVRDKDSVYILFYGQDSGEQTSLTKFDKFLSEEEELEQVNLLLRVFKPKPLSLPAPAAKLKRSSSSGNIVTACGSDALDRAKLEQAIFPALPKVSTTKHAPLMRSFSNPKLHDSAVQYDPNTTYHTR